MPVEDPLMSKVQCTFFRSEVSGWTLTDGDGARGSTNSTWLYLNEDFEV